MKLIAKLDITIYYLLLFYALVSSISIAVQNIVISLAALLAVVRHNREPIHVIVDQGLLKVIGVFLTAMLIAAVFAYNPVLAFARWWAAIYPMFALFLAVGFIKDKESLLRILLVMGVSIFLADCYAIWQGLHGNYRATAFSTGPMMLAGYLIQMIPLLLIVGLGENFLFSKGKFCIIGLTILSGVALVYNGTRGAWIAVVIALLLYGMLNIKENIKIVLGVLVVCLVCASLAMGVPAIQSRVSSISDMKDQSHSERVLLWRSSWRMFQDHPLVGVGPGNFPQVYKPIYMLPEAKEPYLQHAHNNVVHMFVETGIMGGLAFIYMFYYILMAMYRRYRVNQDNIWVLAAFLVTVSVLLQGLTEFNFGSSAVMRMYWFILGLAYTASRVCYPTGNK